jgi:hypothetical protein
VYLPPGSPSTFVHVVIALFVSWLAGLVLWFYKTANAAVVVVQVPQCETCKKQGPPLIHRVDFERVRMTLVVHKNLKAAMVDNIE